MAQGVTATPYLISCIGSRRPGVETRKPGLYMCAACKRWCGTENGLIKIHTRPVGRSADDYAAFRRRQRLLRRYA